MADIANLVETLGKLTVVEAAELVKTLEEAWGVSAAAPVAVADKRVFAACEDGYLYVYGGDGNALPPTRDLGVRQVRSPLAGPLAGAKYDWYTNYGDFGCTNSSL